MTNLPNRSLEDEIHRIVFQRAMAHPKESVEAILALIQREKKNAAREELQKLKTKATVENGFLIRAEDIDDRLDSMETTDKQEGE